MMDVDDVIVPASASQLADHSRTQHCACRFFKGVAEDEVGIVIDFLHPGRALRCCAHHIAPYSERRYARCQVIHHFLYTSPHGVEFA